MGLEEALERGFVMGIETERSYLPKSLADFTMTQERMANGRQNIRNLEGKGCSSMSGSPGKGSKVAAAEAHLKIMENGRIC
jgi:phage terminase large subunit-like protein